ncbi:MAG: PorV/PorQ family protein [candidate division WOR-3 bacterium]
MRKFMKFLIILILIIPNKVLAIKKLAQTGFKFLDVCVGARPGAMGEAYTVISDDANAIFHNPAGMAQMENRNFDFIISRTAWFANIAYNAIGIAINGRNWGNFGFSLIPSPDYGEIIGTIVSETNEKGYEVTGPLEVSTFSFGLAYARKFTDKFMIGGHIKYAYQHLGSTRMLNKETDSIFIQENETYTMAYDLGTIFYPGFKSFRFGMSVRNFSPSVKYEVYDFQLPLTFKIAIGMDLLDLFGEHPGRSFLLAIDAVHSRDYSERIQIGGEYSIGILKLRAGYKFNYDEEKVCLGFGINTGNIKLDFSYSEFRYLNSAERVTLGLSF